MEVILLQKVRNLGDLGDRVKVRAGFGRNFLLPQGMALPATADNVKVFEARRAELEKSATDSVRAATHRQKLCWHMRAVCGSLSGLRLQSRQHACE